MPHLLYIIFIEHNIFLFIFSSSFLVFTLINTFIFVPFSLLALLCFGCVKTKNANNFWNFAQRNKAENLTSSMNYLYSTFEHNNGIQAKCE